MTIITGRDRAKLDVNASIPFARSALLIESTAVSASNLAISKAF